jgi:hypothetical protein
VLGSEILSSDTLQLDWDSTHASVLNPLMSGPVHETRLGLTRTIRTAGLRKNGGSNGFFFRKMSFSESHSAPFGNLAGDSLDHASADVKFVDVTNTTGINDHGDFRAPERVLELFGRIALFECGCAMIQKERPASGIRSDWMAYCRVADRRR